ncbi:GL10799 [Drosophila persimilis]|uniref:GL10799 n=1 Tax=Drosophila persimilis TaxID=7234 RepID=B4G9Y1_DROPE|nr:uncharacterized protein LOC6590363 [Drosophila persimilis]EDW31733.1 GL10799 [Drosophila persimilis]
MEVETSNSASNDSIDKIESSQAPVLNISGRSRDTPRIRGKKKTAKDAGQGQPKISPRTFPTILSRILLKCSSPPALPPRDPYKIDYTQSLGFLCVKKPVERKNLYHMFLSTSTPLDNDFEKVSAMYRNKADFKIDFQFTVATICAGSLYRRVQKHFSDATWNKQRNVFEMEMIGECDAYGVQSKVYQMHGEEVEKLFNYIKYLSITKS